MRFSIQLLAFLFFTISLAFPTDVTHSTLAKRALTATISSSSPTETLVSQEAKYLWKITLGGTWTGKLKYVFKDRVELRGRDISAEVEVYGSGDEITMDTSKTATRQEVETLVEEGLQAANTMANIG